MVTNTGKVAGAEIAQLYIRDPHAPVPRPQKELKGFTKVTLQPGQKQFVRFRLTAKEFAYWDVAVHSWRTDPREYTLLIGSASNRIALEGRVTLK
jgi:beta-glucosidase